MEHPDPRREIEELRRWIDLITLQILRSCLHEIFRARFNRSCNSGGWTRWVSAVSLSRDLFDGPDYAPWICEAFSQFRGGLIGKPRD